MKQGLRVIYRLDLTADELEQLQALPIKERALKDKIINPKLIQPSKNKIKATQTATAKRTANAKAKIQNAINTLKLYNKKITAYQIAKESGCSYNTVKKYYKGAVNATNSKT